MEVHPAQPPTPVSHEGLGGMTALAFDAVVRQPAGLPSPYVDAAATPAAGTRTAARVRAVPYFAWGNRAVGGMRVWLPAAPTATPPRRDGTRADEDGR